MPLNVVLANKVVHVTLIALHELLRPTQDLRREVVFRGVFLPNSAGE
jgi:hypothetical protein